MSNVPHPVANILIGDDWEDVVTLEQMHAYAAAVTAAKDAEIAQLRADATDRQNNVVMPLRERVRELTTQAMFNTSTIERLRAEVAGLRAELLKSLADNAPLREFVEHVRRNGSTHLANMAVAVLAARKGGA